MLTNTSSRDWVFHLDTTPRIIGRGVDADVCLPSMRNTVSRRHASIWQANQWAWIRDLSSTHGTYVNGVRLASERDTRIDHGDRVLLGGLELVVVDSRHVQRNLLLDDPGPASAEDDTLKLPGGQTRQHDEIPSGLAALSHAEREIVLWFSRGLTRPEDIAATLHRSPNTIRTQLNSIFQKLNVHSRDELLSYLLRLEDPKIENR